MGTGPDDARVRALVESKRASRADDAIAAQAKAAFAYGAAVLVPQQLRFIMRVADQGFSATILPSLM